MRKVIIAAAAASVAALVAMPAAAQGWYVEANVGPSLNAKIKLNGTVDDGTGPVTGSGDLKLKKGWLISGVVGRDLGSNLSVELEGLVARNKLRAVTLPDDSTALGGYRVTTSALLVNGVYTIPTGMMVSPYVGVGIGVGDSSLDYNAQYLDKKGMVYQGKIGAKIALNPKTSVNVGVRYLEGVRFKIQDDNINGYAVDFRAKPREAAVTVGIHYNF